METTIINSAVLSDNFTLTKSDLNKIKAAHAVREVFSCMPEGTEFRGWELKEKCLEIYPELKDLYLDTFLRAMRHFCHNKYILVSRSKSLYQRIADNAIEHAAEVYLYEKHLQEGTN